MRHKYRYRLITDETTNRKYYLYVWEMNEGEGIEDVIDDIVLKALHNELIYSSPMEDKIKYIYDCVRYASLAYKVNKEYIVRRHRFRPDATSNDNRAYLKTQLSSLVKDSLDKLQMNGLECLLPIVN